MQPEATPIEPRIVDGLPAHFYYDPAHYQRELESIWYRQWLPLCRSDELAGPRAFRVVEVGDQSILVVRNREGQLNAFHNTCRHRGSILCVDDRGQFQGPAIVCPYHAWTYSLDGDLVGTPRQLDAENFDQKDYPLYPIALGEWAGYVFGNLLGAAAEPFVDALQGAAETLRNWPLAELAVGRKMTTDIACNWKLFWENYQECFHCPGLHPELCRIVPTYAKALMSEGDQPDVEVEPGVPDPPLAPTAVTWTLDGTSKLPPLPGLTPEERTAGQTFVQHTPGFFLVAHVDYARIVRVRPLGPERTQLQVEWLFPPEVLAQEGFDLEHATALGERVVEQDARACELNQRGLRSRAHARGVLVPQEYEVRDFQRWVLEQVGEASGTS